MPKRTRKMPQTRNAKQTIPIKETMLFKRFCGIINEATKTSLNHQKYLREIQKHFKNAKEAEVLEVLTLSTKDHFSLGDDNPQVECFMEFIALYINNLEQEQQILFNMTHKGEEAEMHLVMKSMLNFCIEISNENTNFIRKLALQFINIMLNKMGDGSMEDDLFDKLSSCTLERMQDTHYKVRVEAVFAAKRLQDPCVLDDKICKAYRFHLQCDPQVAVRKAVLECIGYSTQNIESIIRRTLDEDELIRLVAYERLMEVPLKNIKLRQRQSILYRGLKEKSSKIQTFIVNILIPVWVEQSDKSFLNFFDNIRYDITESSKKEFDDVAERVMKAFYLNHSIAELCSELGLDNDLRLIAVSEVKVHTLVYWRNLAACVLSSNADLDMVLPELSFFVDLMNEHDFAYGRVMGDSSTESNVLLDKLEYSSAKLELLHMIKLFDRSDEVGRNKLKEYLLSKLLSDKYLSEHHVREFVVILKEICIEFSEWHQELLNIVTDIYEPVVPVIQPESVSHSSVTNAVQKTHMIEVQKANLKVDIFSLTAEREEAIAVKDYMKAQQCDEKIEELKKELDALCVESVVVNSALQIEEDKREVTSDSKEIVRAFMIIYFMLSEFKYPLTPELRMIHQDVIHPQMKSDVLEVEYWALKCSSCICIEDLSLAKEYFPIYYIKMFADVSEAEETLNIANLALKIIFDLFNIFSLEDFAMEDSSKHCNTTKFRKLFTSSQTEDSDIETDEDDDRINYGVFIQIIIKLLQECTIHSTRLIVIQGLAKLLVNSKITSQKVLGMLMLMYHHPEMDLMENNDIRQHIVLIFSEIGSGRGGGPEALVYALIPAIKIRSEAPSDSPLLQIDLFDISKLVLALIAVESGDFQNLLALTICDELKRMSRDDELEIVLCKTLVLCNIKGDEQLKVDLKSYIEQLLPSIHCKMSIKYLKQALANIEERDNYNVELEQVSQQSGLTVEEPMDTDNPTVSSIGI